MPYKDPPTQNQWQSGQSGNPTGYSHARRLAGSIHRLIDEHGLHDEIALVLIAKALGRDDLITYKDGDGTERIRDPEFIWFKELVGRLDSADDFDEIWARLDALRAHQGRTGSPGAGEPAP